MKPFYDGEKVILTVTETGEKYVGMISSQDQRFISLKNVKGIKGILVFYNDSCSVEKQ